jgi:hypothetical protein
MASDTPAIDEEGAYRSLHAPAVVALALALASCVALLVPQAWALALVAIVVALLARSAVARSPETLTGGGIASLSLGIALAVLVAVVARGVVANRLHSAEADKIGDRFVQLLSKGDNVGALELTLAHRSRRPSADEAQLFYTSNEEAAKRLAEFLARPEVVALRGTGDAAPRLVASDPAVAGPRGVVSVFRYYDVPTDALGPGARRTVAVTLRRYPAEGIGRPAWRVSDFAFVNRDPSAL